MASLNVVSSPTVGPDPIHCRSFPETSLMMKLIIVAPEHFLTSCPPFSSLKCFRTVFNSLIVAPLLSSWSIIVFTSSSVHPYGTSIINEDAPPLKRKINRSVLFIFFSSFDISSAATTLFTSGKGCPAKIGRTCFRVKSKVSRVAITPSLILCFRIFSTSNAMLAAAFPAPAT